jgi:O-antigen/teichoic acid export membrane protein
MGLRAALGWSSAQAVARIGLGFFSAKISAIYLGPAGVALVGQLTSFIQAVQGAIGNGAGTAVVNLTAQRRNEPVRLGVLWATALRLVLILALTSFALISTGARPLANWLLSDSNYWPAIVFAAFAVVMVVAETIITCALNGLKQVDLIAKTSIGSSLLEVSVFASLVYFFGLWGGLMGCAALYAAKLLVTCLVAFRSGLVRPEQLVGTYNPDTLREIARFYPMLLANSIALPLAQILVRNSVIDGLGLENAGFLQSAWRLSDMYVGVMTTALSLYFMSHYSSLSSDGERGLILRRTALQLLVLTTGAAMVVYLLRDLIITIVLTRQFLPMGDLLPFQLVADVLKMAGYPLQMALVAQRRMYWYIAQATGGPAIFAFLTAVWMPEFGSQAAPMAYAMSYLFVLIGLAYALRKLLFKRLGVKVG